MRVPLLPGLIPVLLLLLPGATAFGQPAPPIRPTPEQVAAVAQAAEKVG